jgi:hypothetical protein
MAIEWREAAGGSCHTENFNAHIGPVYSREGLTGWLAVVGKQCEIHPTSSNLRSRI